jgi:membrane-associated protease RseP (regulator of RpoE activity)
MRWVFAIATVAVVLVLLAGPATALDREKELEDAIKKLDEYYKKLRRELEEKLRRERGKTAPPPEKADGAPYMGLSLGPLSPGVRVILNLGEGEGLMIRKVVEDGPAAKAGIRELDILLRFRGKKIGSMDDVRKALGGASPGEEVDVTILRGGKRKNLRMVIGAKGRAGAAPGEKTAPQAKSEIERFLRQTLRERESRIKKNIRALLGTDLERRLKARRFFEKLLIQSARKRRQVVREIEAAVEEMIGDLSPQERRKLREVFGELMGGARDTFEKVVKKRSQKKKDIEAYLERLLGGAKKSPSGKKDDIDKLIEDLLGKKNGKKNGKKDPGPKPKTDDFVITPEMEAMLKSMLGEKGFERVKEMLKDPAMREMVKNFLPKNFDFSADSIRKLMEQYGVTEEELPDRLRQMGLSEEAIENILKKLKGGEKKGKAYLGVRASEIDQAQRDRLGITGGLVITRVTDGGPADKAGLLPDDIILKANGTVIASTEDFKGVLKKLVPGDTLRLQVLREGYKKVVTVTLTKKG